MTGQRLTLSRPATYEEKAVVRWLLVHAATRPEAEALVSKVDELLVVTPLGTWFFVRYVLPEVRG